MNGIDIVLSIVLVLTTLNGLRQGLITALSSLVGWVFGLLLAFRYHELIQPMLVQYVANENLQKLLAFILILAVIFAISFALAYLFKSLFSQLKLTWLNVLCGGVFGLIKSLVMVLLLIHVLNPWFSTAQLWKSSLIIDCLQPYAAITAQYSQQVVQKTAEEWQQTKTDAHHGKQDAIIRHSTLDSQGRVDNPFFNP